MTQRVVRLTTDPATLPALVPDPVGGRALVGITGSPGAGKSTLTRWLAARLDLAVVPMDGFHFADVELVRRGLLQRKGAPDSFDAEGYAALLDRVRAARPGDPPVVGPGFERDLEQPLAGAVPVPAEAAVVVTEGSYLLLDEPRWAAVRARLDAVWHVRVGDDVRRERLLARHVEFGKTPSEARAWVEAVDDPNAELVEAAAVRADVVVDLDDWSPA